MTEILTEKDQPDNLWPKVEPVDDNKISLKTKTRRVADVVYGMSKIEENIFDPEKHETFFSQDLKDLEGRIEVQLETHHKKRIITPLYIDWDENELKERGIKIPSWNRLTAFDREVYMAVTSLYGAAPEENRLITPRMVYQVLCGNKGRINPTSNILKLISGSIERMSVIRVTIDTRAEFEAKRNNQAEYTDYMLNTTVVRGSINGVMVDCICLNTPPILYLYANAKNQIARGNINMLNAPVSNTQENIELKGYLMRRISSMKSEKSKLGNIIRYDTLYKHLRLEAEKYTEQALRHKKKDVRDTTKKILEDWKAKGEIKDFEEVAERRVKTKIIIKT